MKRFIYSILAIFLACAFITSCSSNEEEPEKVIEPQLTLSGDTKPVVEAKGGTISITVTANKAWSASSGQSWCKVESSSGQSGTATVNIRVEENTSTDERNAQVVFTCEGVSKSMTVTQKQKDAIALTASKVEVTDQSGTIEIVVNSNVNVTAEVEASAKEWITPVTTKAMAKHVLQFKVSENENFEKREGKIYIKGGELKDSVVVYQQGTKPNIVISQDEYTVSSNGDDITVQLRSNINYQVIMPQGITWLKEVTSKAYSDYTHYFSVDANESYDSRSTEIIFQETNGSISDTVKVIQLQKDAIIVAKNEYIFESPAAELTFNVSTNLDFDVNCSVEWIKYVQPTKGLKDVAVKFTIDENTAQTQREGVITISKGETKQQIKIIQYGKELYESTICILHNNIEYIIPGLTGSNINGMIYWGDGSESEYAPNLRHMYSNQQDYLLTIKLNNATEIKLPNLVGIKELDLSKF